MKASREVKEMKKIATGFVLILIMVAFVTGCDVGSVIPDPTGGVILTVTRSIYLENNPGIKIGCESVVFNYDNRQILIKNPKNIGSWSGELWVCDMEILEDKIILKLPENADYYIYINGQYHLLPKIVKK